jgi:hypothetical protein
VMAPHKTHFKTPEGRYTLHSERTSGLVPFQSRRAPHLTVAALHEGMEQGMYMLFNVGDFLHITPYDATEKASPWAPQPTQPSFDATCGACCACGFLLWVMARMASAPTTWLTCMHGRQVRTMASASAATFATAACGPRTGVPGTSQVAFCTHLLLLQGPQGRMQRCHVACARTLHAQDPLKSLVFNPTTVRDGNPCAHAFAPASDGYDLLVGIANGEGAALKGTRSGVLK